MKKKYISINGGLGNQMFQYALSLSLNSKGIKNDIFVIEKNIGHSGFELVTLFNNIDVNKPLSYLYQRIKFPFRWLFVQLFKELTDKHFIFQPEALNPENNYYFYYGSWQSELYFKDIRNEILEAFKFNEDNINEKTKDILKIINSNNSVSVHIRRGDYLEEPYKTGFGSCCTITYYMDAIKKINELTLNPFFVFFSDDIDWAKENFLLNNSIFVEHNTKKDSWQDMYLMSKCNHNIIANSSFSWWGAWLNKNEEKYVTAPKRWWFTLENDDVVPEKWIRI